MISREKIGELKKNIKNNCLTQGRSLLCESNAPSTRNENMNKSLNNAQCSGFSLKTDVILYFIIILMLISLPFEQRDKCIPLSCGNGK